MANHSSILAWESHGQRSWQVTVQRVTKSRTCLKGVSTAHLLMMLIKSSAYSFFHLVKLKMCALIEKER